MKFFVVEYEEGDDVFVVVFLVYVECVDEFYWYVLYRCDVGVFYGNDDVVVYVGCVVVIVGVYVFYDYEFFGKFVFDGEWY